MGQINAVHESKLQAFMDAQILQDEGAPGAEERLREAVMGLEGMPPCPWCNADIRDFSKAVVVKRSMHSPSMLLHDECAAEEFNKAVKIRARGGRAARALGLDVI